ncbi:hypothetical protein CHL67_11065 [Prosthecochloris sp. GSB1]|nr:hypothetical protein CHL67_11065 [Prosthecochloris sp. GSB1]
MLKKKRLAGRLRFFSMSGLKPDGKGLRSILREMERSPFSFLNQKSCIMKKHNQTTAVKGCGKIIAFRKRRRASGTGLSHYILIESSGKRQPEKK